MPKRWIGRRKPIFKRKRGILPKPTITYVVKAVELNLLKIGKTTSIKKRLADIKSEVGNLRLLRAINFDCERDLHDICKENRAKVFNHKEYFSLDCLPKIDAFINENIGVVAQ